MKSIANKFNRTDTERKSVERAMTFMSGVIFVDVSERSSLPIVFFFKYRNEMAFSDCSNYSEFYK